MKKAIGVALSLAILPVLLASVAKAEQTMNRTHTARPAMSQKQTDVRTQQGVQQTAGRTMTQNQTWNRQIAAQATMDPQVRQQWIEGQNNLVNRHYPEAIRSFQDVLSIQPGNVHALDGLATAFYFQGRYEEALQQVNRAIALDPINARLFHTKGLILDAQDKPVEAIESYLTFTSLNPEDSSAVMTLRRVDELQRRSDVQLSDSWRNYLQGLRFLSLGQPDQALPLFERYLTLEPNAARPNLLLGSTYLNLGQPDRAIPYFESALRVQSDNPVAYYQLGHSYELRGETGNAKDAFKKFVQFAPQSESAMLLNRRIDMHQPQAQ